VSDCSLVEADVLQHPRPTVTSTHTLREVDAIKAQLSSVTESRRQHQQQADAMMATFLERSQAQLDGIRVRVYLILRNPLLYHYSRCLEVAGSMPYLPTTNN